MWLQIQGALTVTILQVTRNYGSVKCYVYSNFRGKKWPLRCFSLCNTCSLYDKTMNSKCLLRKCRIAVPVWLSQWNVNLFLSLILWSHLQLPLTSCIFVTGSKEPDLHFRRALPLVWRTSTCLEEPCYLHEPWGHGHVSTWFSTIRSQCAIIRQAISHE